MTVVPDDRLMTLICDDCGDTTTGNACVLPDAEVVWTLVSEHGWSGSPFAVGPHRCPPCSIAGPAPSQLLGLDQVDGCDDAPGHGEDRLRAALRDAVEFDGRAVVDLHDMEQIDPAGLGLLVRAHQEARQRGVVLCLAAPSRFVRTVLHTMRLDGLFPTFATRQEALAATGPALTATGPALTATGPAPAR
ncbi:STAS domain-containing protein [Micromonospora carbonacea]|uniref:STAS domain-containing protein n=1 Tax=Micromonospora carbonacea TaxID=47853 RepID=A0A7H8XJF5_9ACTN|nr:STAS domain-containing protein [Micromonospora carbonacea]MBB5827054.1 anti-anti-sigma factor [Micromonospora carbonacea]QLD25126.1 STAS domain-containing protein [Micromonospora carbonacea]